MNESREKYLAVITISSELRTHRLSKAGLKRIRKAAKVLGFSDLELRSIESACEYRKGADGELYDQWK